MVMIIIISPDVVVFRNLVSEVEVSDRIECVAAKVLGRSGNGGNLGSRPGIESQ